MTNEVDLTEQNNKDNALKKALVGQVIAAQNFAEWIFYDAYYNCDNEAPNRTEERLHLIQEAHGVEAIFGIVGYWGMRSYWKAQDIHKIIGKEERPDILPSNLDKFLAYDPTDPGRRALVSAQQFVSTMTHTNPLMAKAIFDAACNAGEEDFMLFVQQVLVVALRYAQALDAVKAQY